MYSYMRNFFSEARAERFAEELKAQGITDIEISSAKDGFGQIQYRVAWNK